MATIQELIRQVTFDDVWLELTNISGSIDEYKESFQNMFNDLRDAVPAENTAQMTVWLKPAEEDPFAAFYDADDDSDESAAADADGGLQIYAYIPGDPDSYAIGVKPPEQIAGLSVADETLQSFAPAVIIAYCLIEITYSSSLASSTYGTKLDQAGGGLYAAQRCVEGGLQNLSLDHLREQLGLRDEKEDLKEKYGFLF